MGLTGKLIAAIEFKAGGDVFHELFRHNPQHLSTVTPGKVQGCDLHEGEFGHVGTIITWRYTHGEYQLSTWLLAILLEKKKKKKLFEFSLLCWTAMW